MNEVVLPFVQDSPERKAFLKKIEQFMMKMIAHAPVDGAADQMAKRFLHESLPPVLTDGKLLLEISQTV